jgi:hypothetical protein
MKRLLSLVLAATPGLIILSTDAPAAQRLTAYMCQPLNVENRQRCCQATNWRDIVLLWQQHQCERSRERRGQSIGALDNRGNPGGPGNPGNNNNDNTRLGNPGNSKSVGRAGEHESKGMMADGVGVRGASENHRK